MKQPGRILIAFTVLAVSPFSAIVYAQHADPNSPRYKGVVALGDFLASGGEKALKQFVDGKVSKKLLESMGKERVSSELDKLRSKFAGTQRTNARPEGPFSAYILFSGGKSITFEMEPRPPYRFLRIGSIGGEESPSQDGGCCVTSPQHGGSETASQRSSVASFAELDEKLRAEAAAETFSGVVLVAKDGEPIFHKAYGYADKKAGRRNRKDTKFNVGSINKLFTMVAVYQLLDAGKLALDDTIGKYLPQFPPSVANSVTVKHLLEHRSGWAAYWDNSTWKARRSELRSLDDYMDFIKDIPLDFEPGSRKQYSNTGYEVLGAIVQKASGQSYYEYVREHVYAPAGMMDTDAYQRDGNTPNMAIGYAGGGYATDNSTMLSMKGTAAGGGMSTAADLMHFAKAIDEGTLIPNKYANRLRGGAFAGGGPGVNATLKMSVAGGHTIVVLSNFDPPTAGRIAAEITGILRNNVAAVTGDQQYRIGVELEVDYDGSIAVSFLIPGAPGERGGLEPDDVILAINGKPIADDPVGQIDAVLVKPDPIQLKVRRGDVLKYITITPEPMDAATTQTASSGAAPCKPGCSTPSGNESDQSAVEKLLGVLTEVPSAKIVKAMWLATRIRIEGRLVTRVLSGSPADRASIQTGDVMLQLGDNRLYSRDGLSDFLRSAKPGAYPIRFKRGGANIERKTEITFSSDDLPRPDAGIRWDYSGMDQLDEALSAAKSQGKRLLVGLSGSETCCAFSRFETPTIAALLAGDEVVQLADRYVTLIIRRPHAYWFLEHVNRVEENTQVIGVPDGLMLPGRELLPIPAVYLLDSNGDVLDHIAVDGRGSSAGLEEILRKSL